MSKQMIFALVVEGWLVLLTLLMLMQPSFVFQFKSDQAQRVVTVFGLFLLSVTFCWSVVFGCLIALNQFAHMV